MGIGTKHAWNRSFSERCESAEILYHNSVKVLIDLAQNVADKQISRFVCI